MFRVCEMTAFCIRRRISPPQALNSSVIASTTSLDHPPRTSVMMLYCQMSCPGNGCLGSQWGGGAYLVVFSSCFFSLFTVHGRLISTARTLLLLLLLLLLLNFITIIIIIIVIIIVIIIININRLLNLKSS